MEARDELVLCCVRQRNGENIKAPACTHKHKPSDPAQRQMRGQQPEWVNEIKSFSIEYYIMWNTANTYTHTHTQLLELQSFGI